jgi:hypothetical protein
LKKARKNFFESGTGVVGVSGFHFADFSKRRRGDQAALSAA